MSETVDIVKNIRSIYTENLFSGKTALVTGASRGIGRSIAVALGALGAKVIVNYSGNQQAAAETVELIKNASGVAVESQFNVSDFTVVQEKIKSLEKEHGTIDILVNNAGISKDNLFVKFKEEEWDSTIDTNLKGAFNCCRAVAMSMMRKRSGKIINVSSVIGLTGNSGQAAYAASKSGILGLTKSLAIELASRNVQVNAIAPGYISTDMTGSLGEDLIKKVLMKIPSERLGEGLDIAKLAVFLASEASNYMTGQTLAVDGGMTMY